MVTNLSKNEAKNFFFNFFFASFLLKLVTMNGVIRIFPDFQQKARGYKIMSNTVLCHIVVPSAELQAYFR